MKRTIHFLLLIGIITISLPIQAEAQAEDKISISNTLNISFSRVTFCDWEYFFQDESMPNLKLDYNYKLNDYFSVGGYGGTGLYEEWIVRKGDQYIGRMYNKMSFSILMGLNGKMHLFHLPQEDSKFDCYITGNLGFIYFLSSDNESMNIRPGRGLVSDISGYFGAAYYFKGNWGPFLELGYRNFKYHKTTRPTIIDFNTGLTFKF